MLADKTSIDADAVVWATGCQSGIDKIELTKDGTFGPMRAVNSAEMAIKHLCIHKRRTEKSMMRSASLSLSGCSANAVTGWLFQSGTNAMETFVKMHLDLMFAGHVNILDFVQHVVEIFCFAKQTPLKIRLPPKSFKV